MPFEPLRLDFARYDSARQDDLEGSLTEADGGFRAWRHAEVVSRHAVESIAAPVDLFLQGNHLLAEPAGASARRPQRAD